MALYEVFQQHPPISVPAEQDSEFERDFYPNLVSVGHVEAPNREAAIALARSSLKAFRRVSRKTLKAFPIVQEVPWRMK